MPRPFGIGALSDNYQTKPSDTFDPTATLPSDMSPKARAAFNAAMAVAKKKREAEIDKLPWISGMNGERLYKGTAAYNEFRYGTPKKESNQSSFPSASAAATIIARMLRIAR